MTATGVTRPLDNLGRLVIPVELRKHYDMNTKDRIEFYTTADGLYIRKYAVSCDFCQEQRDLIDYKDKKICKSCAEKIYQSFQK